MKKLLALAFVIWSTAALAQGELPNHSIAIGKGPGVIGFGAMGPCAANQLPMWTGVTVDPACTTASSLPVAGGTNLQVQYNNSGVLGGYTNTQLTALINPFSSTLSGATPASGGGTVNFLRADGTWAPVAPGGASGTVQYNNSSVFGGMSGTSWDDTNRALALTGATITTSHPVLDLSQTWNAGGVTFAGLQFDATDTASAADSSLLNLKTGGNTQFAVDKTGNIQPSAAHFGNIMFGGHGVNSGWFTITSGQVALFSSSGTLAWSNGSIEFGTSDIGLYRAGTNALGIGNSLPGDIAAPPAMTINMQSVLAGTSDTAGADTTIIASKGTGTGVGGNIIFKTAPPSGSGSTQNTAITATIIDHLGHIRVGAGTAPALTSCGGGSPSILGTDEAGEVTMGTTATGCVITFNKPYASAPFCVLNWQATPLASQSWTVSNSAITTTQTSTSGNILNYICRARNGG